MGVMAVIACGIDVSLVLTVTAVRSYSRGKYEVELEDYGSSNRVATVTVDQEVRVGDRMTLSLRGIEYDSSKPWE